MGTSYAPSITTQQHQQSYQEEQPKPPPKPFKIDSSGLTTSHLPPPPARKDGADGRTPGIGPLGSSHVPRTPASPAPPPATRAGVTQSPAAGLVKPGPPSLPPRLPPRGAATSPASPPVSAARTPVETPSASSSGGYINGAATSRLGAAGISVPGFGIGGTKATSVTNTTGATTPTTTTTGSIASAAGGGGRGGGGGTTWAQKQAALRTASQFNKDPSSVSLADAKAAASTATNFHQRHGAQVTSGLKTANALNQKFGASNSHDRGGAPEPIGDHRSASISSAAASFAGADIAAKKKAAPPPPPKKKPTLPGSSTTSDGHGGPPPPVPLATRPAF